MNKLNFPAVLKKRMANELSNVPPSSLPIVLRPGSLKIVISDEQVRCSGRRTSWTQPLENYCEIRHRFVPTRTAKFARFYSDFERGFALGTDLERHLAGGFFRDMTKRMISVGALVHRDHRSRSVIIFQTVVDRSTTRGFIEPVNYLGAAGKLLGLPVASDEFANFEPKGEI